MSPDQKRNNRREELYLTMAQLARFATNKLYDDEEGARNHLEKAIGELAAAHRLLVWDRP